MRKLTEQYKLVKETHYRFEGIEERIIGRVYEIEKGCNARYFWDISHFNCLENQYAVYMPSAISGKTLEEVEDILEKYVMRFEKAVGWKKNPCF